MQNLVCRYPLWLMKSTFLSRAHEMDEHTIKKRTTYDKKEIWEPLFYKPRAIDDQGEKTDYPTEEFLAWSIADAKKDGYGRLTKFIEEVVDTYEAWRW